ncbi:uncharacterized protein LOC123291395 [Chrysoperla carnea]|uniref:uncharacterized protein LOC123291395 n=1 Tax=Chrysoperla carnea TaxID=189513 RepID=UPI001D080B64|nr:uncharacterized protein LOC123291395 [Chrysoperla carnea]
MCSRKSFEEQISSALNEISHWDTQKLCAFLEKYEFNDARLVAESTNKNGYDFLNAADKVHTWRLSKTRLKKFLEFVQTVRENALYYVPIEAEAETTRYENTNGNIQYPLAKKLKEKLKIFTTKQSFEMNHVLEEEPEDEKYHTVTQDSSFDESEYDDTIYDTDYETVSHNENTFENDEVEEDIYADVDVVTVPHYRSKSPSKRRPRRPDVHKPLLIKNNSNIDVNELLETSSRFKSIKESGKNTKFNKPSGARDKIPAIPHDPKRKEKKPKTSSWQTPLQPQPVPSPPKKSQVPYGSPIKSKPMGVVTPMFAQRQNTEKQVNMRSTEKPVKMLPTRELSSPCKSKYTKSNCHSAESSDEDDGYLKPGELEKVLKKKRDPGSTMQAPTEASKPSKPSNNFGGTLSRPLPAPPKRNLKNPEPSQNPFILNVSRQRSEEILDGKEDGCFLFRPTKVSNCLCTLVVMFNQCAYHINVRENVDGTLSLGTVEKDNEPSFDNITEIIKYFQKNQLKLISGDCVHGQVWLTDCYSYDDNIY